MPRAKAKSRFGFVETVGSKLPCRDKLTRMLPLDDVRWTDLDGGYRMRFDPRPFLADIEAGRNTPAAWHELLEGLHHQGDIGEASYATVPHLVRMCRERGGTAWSGWSLCALVVIIELARQKGHNPELPDWCRGSYLTAIRELAVISALDLPGATNEDIVRALLSVIALSKALPRHAESLISYSEEEMREVERHMWG